MAIISCPECSRQVSDKALKCPECAHPIASSSKLDSKTSRDFTVLQDRLENRVKQHQLSVKVNAVDKNLKVKLERRGLKLFQPDYTQIWLKLRAELTLEILKDFTHIEITSSFEGDNKIEWQRQNQIDSSGKLISNSSDNAQLIIRAAIFLTIFFIGGGLFFNPFRRFSTLPFSSFTSNQFTLSKFNQLDAGISYDQAVSILGTSGSEASRVSIPDVPITIIYTWQNPDGSNLLVTFQDDKLVSKAQAGLQ